MISACPMTASSRRLLLPTIITEYLLCGHCQGPVGQRQALVSKAEPGLCLEVLEMMELTVNKQRCFQGHCGVTRPGWGKGTRKLKEESWIGVKVYLT